MTVREKIQAGRSQRKNGDLLGKAVRKAFFRIMCGYLGGTIIGLLLRRLIHG